MYGTIAHLHVKAGMEDKLRQAMETMEGRDVDGFVASYVYRLDKDPRELMLVALFTDRATYVRNADDPAQDVAYRQLRELLESDPEWHDGEGIWSSTTAVDA